MKKLMLILLIAVLIVSLCGCNYQLIDTTYRFDYAYISLPNGEIIEGDVDSWRDYDDGDQIQVTIDGTTYLTHSNQVVLIAK